jgi:hypothetical protein
MNVRHATTPFCAVGKVTRWGEFLLIGKLFSLGSVKTIQKLPKFSSYFFTDKGCINFGKTSDGLYVL